MSSDSNNIDADNTDLSHKSEIEGKSTTPTLLSIVKDIAIASVLIFTLLVFGWVLLSN